MKGNYTYGVAIGSVEIVDSIPVKPRDVLPEIEKRDIQYGMGRKTI